MSLNGDSKLTHDQWNSKAPMPSPFKNWLETHGKDAFKDFREDHPTSKLSYEAWCQTEQVYGGYLFYAASMIWDEDGSSEDERTKRRRIARVPDNDPKKTVFTNGNGAPRTAGSATPMPVANSGELSASGKRKRKPRKKYLSQELVASDEELEERVEATPANNGAAAPTAPAIAVNGRRKSSSRKPRKKPLSEETISPEDENDDPMEIDAAFIASPLPVRSAPRTAAATKQLESPKKATLKQSSVKKSRESFLVRLPFHLWDAVNLDEKSEEMVLDKDSDNKGASVAEVSRPAVTPAAKPSANAEFGVKADTNTDQVAETATAEGTPDPSTANTRRGLRNRKPAQQRPYYHDAQLFEDTETGSEEEGSLELSSPAQSRNNYDMSDFPAGALWDILISEVDRLYDPPNPECGEKHMSPERLGDVDNDLPKTKHFKGKGRAWKKEGSDEDEEFTPKQKKAAKAAKAKADKANAKAEKAAEKAAADDNPKQKKKIGRPRKSNLSEDAVRDESDNDTSVLGGETNPQTTPTQPPKRGRGRPRKSALSSELVRDDSEDEAPAPAPKPVEPRTMIDSTTPPKPKSTSRPSTATSTTHVATPKKRGRPRKSDISTTPAKSSATGADETEAHVPQRRGSSATSPANAAKPKTTRARTSISSAPDAPTPVSASASASTSTPVSTARAIPNLNRGAALVESLYPREPSHAPSQASPVSTPAPTPTAPASLSIGEPAFASTEASVQPPLEVEGVAAKEAETKEAEMKEAETKEAETKEAETKEAETKEAETKEAETKEAETKEAETKKEEKEEEKENEENKEDREDKVDTHDPPDPTPMDQDREMSASMSLSSDSEL
ncbi:uncharacterized protein EKO05_0009666 [Ascochyta rabiei]|uniref:DNA binding n=1 Tax=Didymella rabiei TaxID=5454 RepID=A0A163CRC9_DIDRA|nr:uncharacterized protein EKO05_0009666 [Ascochyta rabiei]KZM22640.1 DNA binding [Ascochyta rabiei]UPX19402.1 hypothetical protein EKO05_0009666 [Ascochyta rabiei]